MNSNSTELIKVLDSLQEFVGAGLTEKLSDIEANISNLDLNNVDQFLILHRASRDALTRAGKLKLIASQIDVSIHALGILLCLPHILEAGEKVQYVSLGAGNTGKAFDLETNFRVAEFKFISWKGGPESIRQNSIFKDFFMLAEYPTEKRRYLYVLGTKYPLKFFNSGRALSSVLSRGDKVKKKFEVIHGSGFRTVREYYDLRKSAVHVVDVLPFVPELIGEFQ